MYNQMVLRKATHEQLLLTDSGVGLTLDFRQSWTIVLNSTTPAERTTAKTTADITAPCAWPLSLQTPHQWHQLLYRLPSEFVLFFIHVKRISTSPKSFSLPRSRLAMLELLPLCKIACCAWKDLLPSLLYLANLSFLKSLPASSSLFLKSPLHFRGL